MNDKIILITICVIDNRCRKTIAFNNSSSKVGLNCKTEKPIFVTQIAHIQTHTLTYIHTYVRTYVRTYIHTFVCVCIICIYIQAYTDVHLYID